MRHLLWVAAVAALVVGCGGGGGDSAAPSSQGGGGSVASAGVTGSGADGAAFGPGAPASAALLGGEVSMSNATTAGDQVLRAVGARADGGHAVAWWSDDGTLRLQRYDSAGGRSGGELTLPFHVDGVAPGALPVYITGARLAIAPDGGVLVAYAAARDLPNAAGQFMMRQGIYVQRFNADGSQAQAETAILTRDVVANYRTPGLAVDQAVALADGGYAVGWTTIAFSSVNITYASYHQRLDAQGRPLGTATFAGSYQGVAGALRLAADPLGGYTVALTRPIHDGTRFVPHISITHITADGGARPVVAERSGDAVLLPLSGDRYVLFSGSAAGATRQPINADGSAAGTAVSEASLPAGAWPLADGSFVALFAAGGTATVQRYDRDAAPVGEALSLQAGASDFQAASLNTAAGIALGWSAGQDVYTQRVTAGR